MAQDSMIGGLFSTPEQLYAQQNQQALSQAASYGQMDPLQAARAAVYYGGNRLAQAGAQALGVEDPLLKQLSNAQRIMQGVDQNDPESLANASRAFNQAGDIPRARALAQAAQEAALKQSQITRNTREARAAANRVVEADGRQYLVNSLTGEKISDIGAAPTKAGALSPLGKLEAERADIVAQFGEDDPRVKRYDDAISKATKGKSIGQEIGEAVATSFGMLGKALGPALKKEGEETGQFAAKDFNALGSAVAAGTASKRNLATLETALQNSFTGKFADSKESIVTSLTALGVPVGDDLKQAASNKQLVDAMGTRYVFPLVKNFPGSLAAKELDRLEKTAPNSLQQPETIVRLVNLMKVDLAENEYTYNQAKKYKETNKSTINFNQADSKIEFQNKLGKLQGLVSTVRKKNSMTKEEQQQINALKEELGV
jgi:hypothetical protein